jgi:hypothetical protein
MEYPGAFLQCQNALRDHLEIGPGQGSAARINPHGYRSSPSLEIELLRGLIMKLNWHCLKCGKATPKYMLSIDPDHGLLCGSCRSELKSQRKKIDCGDRSCCICGTQDGSLHKHHIVYGTRNEKGVTVDLCTKCHRRVHCVLENKKNLKFLSEPIGKAIMAFVEKNYEKHIEEKITWNYREKT